VIGLKAVVPSGDLVTALREQKLLTVGAGENVVRFLPPLIVSEAEIEESVAGSSAPAWRFPAVS
jgi:Ornithine/acetylornithine aminotransferase